MPIGNLQPVIDSGDRKIPIQIFREEQRLGLKSCCGRNMKIVKALDVLLEKDLLDNVFLYMTWKKAPEQVETWLQTHPTWLKGSWWLQK